MTRKAYPSDVTDDEWAFVAPYLTLMTDAAPQRDYPLREVFNGLRWSIRAGAPWRLMPNDLPPWHTVSQQTQRWLKADVFLTMVHDLRMLMREIDGRPPTHGPPFWIAAPSNPPRRAAHEPGMMAPNAGKAPRSISPSIR